MNKKVYITLLLLFVGVRFLYMDEVIDDPHAWRQCDTANYIWDFYKNGIDLFHPAVCWMGGYKTLILEFPLPEAIIAALYHVFGPYHLVARIFFLLSFLCSAWYFFKVLRLRFEEDISQIAVLIYLLLPLSLFYSRALHIDFFAIAFTLAMVYHYYQGIIQRSNKHLWIGTAVTAIALLVKAPYILVFGILLIPVVLQKVNIKFVLQHFYQFVIPLVLFYLWTKYSNATNANAPDWSYIPGYRKFDSNAHWYFGSMHQRMVGANWLLILQRIYEECIGGLAGLVLFVVGIYSVLRSKQWKPVALVLLGLILYVAIFFNLNVQHNYYQIPFLAFTALVIAAGIGFLCKLIAKLQLIIGPALILTLAIFSFIYCNNNYFIVPADQIEIAEQISKNTEEDGLVIVNYGGLSVHCPIILYRAHRNGWSIPNHAFDPKLAFKLYKENNCRYLACVNGPELGGELKDIYSFFWSKVIPLQNGMVLHLLDFTRKANGEPYNITDYQQGSK